MANFRTERVESLLREEISSLILRNEVADPRVDAMVTISGVEVSKDLSEATVRVSGFKSKTSLDRSVAGLRSAAGYIQRELGKKLKFHRTPRMRFVADRSIEEGFVVTQRMRDISH